MEVRNYRFFFGGGASGLVAISCLIFSQLILGKYILPKHTNLEPILRGSVKTKNQ